MDKDDLFDFTSDMDFDGDSDLEDYLIEEDELDKILEEENKRGKSGFPDDWQETADDGSEYGLDPYDFETEEEYNETLKEIKENNVDIFESEENEIPEEEEENTDFYSPLGYARWKLEVLKDDPSFFGDPDYVKSETEKCEFLINHRNDIPAAEYYSVKDGFNCGKAVKENFSLPEEITGSHDLEHTHAALIIKYISDYDIDLSLRVWRWLLEVFLPYAKYQDNFEHFLRGRYL